jgi:hypothetical protein
VLSDSSAARAARYRRPNPTLSSSPSAGVGGPYRRESESFQSWKAASFAAVEGSTAVEGSEPPGLHSAHAHARIVTGVGFAAGDRGAGVRLARAYRHHFRAQPSGARDQQE